MTDRPVRCTTSGPEQTRDLAEAAASLLQPGDVIALAGELGAGKTCYVQGTARRLGVEGRVVSPTFMLVRTYEGAELELVHVDVYRLNNLSELRDLGEEVFAPDAVTCLEWGDAVEALLPDDRLEVELLLGDDLEHREIRFRGHGSWVHRRRALEDAVASWAITDDGQDA